jgi:hypothetical protein
MRRSAAQLGRSTGVISTAATAGSDSSRRRNPPTLPIDGDRARRRGRAGGHLPVQRPLRPRPWASRPGGGDLPGHDRRAVPGVGGQGHRGRATLAVGQDIIPSVVLTRLGAVILGLVTVLTAVPLAVVTYQARSRTHS